MNPLKKPRGSKKKDPDFLDIDEIPEEKFNPKDLDYQDVEPDISDGGLEPGDSEESYHNNGKKPKKNKGKQKKDET